MIFCFILNRMYSVDIEPHYNQLSYHDHVCMNMQAELHWSQDDDGVIQQMASPLDPKMIHDHLLRIPDAMYGLEDQPQMQTAVKKL